MRGYTVRTALALGAAGLLAAAGQPASAAPPASPSTARTAHAAQGSQAARAVKVPVIVDCFWHPKVRPADFMLACGDGNSRLTSLHWSQWRAHVAVGRGINVVNDCKPYCAAGHFHRYPVVVRLDRAQPWKKHPEMRHYTRMTLVYTKAAPPGFPHVVTYPLWN